MVDFTEATAYRTTFERHNGTMPIRIQNIKSPRFLGTKHYLRKTKQKHEPRGIPILHQQKSILYQKLINQSVLDYC